MPFEGFSMEVYDFLYSLQFSNTVENLEMNKDMYTRLIKGPVHSLYEALLPHAVSISQSVETRQRRCVSPMYHDMRYMRNEPINGYVYVRFRETGAEENVLSLYFDMWWERVSYGIRVYRVTHGGMERIKEHAILNQDAYIRELKKLEKAGICLEGRRYVRDKYPDIKDKNMNALLNAKELYLCHVEPFTERASTPGLAEDIANSFAAVKRMYAILKDALYGQS